MYTFKLQTVLDHRQLVEDNIQKELAEIRQQAIENQRELEALAQKEMATLHSLQREQAKGLGSDGVLAYHAFLRDLSTRIEKQRQRIEDIRTQEAKKQRALLEAMKKRQILEKLKEQGLDRYHQEVSKKERTFIDEIAVNRFVRSSFNRNGEQ